MQLIQASVTRRANGITDVVVYLIDRATGQLWERVALATTARFDA